MSCQCDPPVRIFLPHSPEDCRLSMTEWDRGVDPDCVCGFNHITEQCPLHGYLIALADGLVIA